MEGLRKLETVQRTIGLLRCSGFCEPDPDAERFLVDFAFFLSERCGELDVISRCQLISRNISKISSLVDDLQSDLKDDIWIKKHVQSCIDNKTNPSLLFNASKDEAVVSMNSMLRSNSTLEDFCRSYFMFHDLDINQPREIFRFLPILSFTESYIYQLDGLNEELVLSPGMMEEHGTNVCTKMMWKEPFKPLVAVLESSGLLTERIEKEFECGEEYWALERKLCSSLVNNKEISIQDAKRAIHLKSFDYRVLNLILYRLRGEEVNEVHMEFLSISELLVEVSDDLFDYEDDVLKNNFNILRMFVKYYGPSDAPIMMARFINEAEEQYAELSRLLRPPRLFDAYRKRCEEATEEGGKRSGPPLGTWLIPPLIQDENGYRSHFSSGI